MRWGKHNWVAEPKSNIECMDPPRPPTTQVRLSTICSIADPGFGFRLLTPNHIYFCHMKFRYIMSAQKHNGPSVAWGVTLPFLPANFMRNSSWRPKRGRTQQLLQSMPAWLIASSLCALMWIKLVPFLANRLEGYSNIHSLSRMRVWQHVKMPFTYLQQVIAFVLSCNISICKYIHMRTYNYEFGEAPWAIPKDHWNRYDQTTG